MFTFWMGFAAGVISAVGCAALYLVSHLTSQDFP